MLRKYSGKDGLYVSGSAGRYSVTDGKIIDMLTRKEVPSFVNDGETYMKVVFLGRELVLKKAVLMCLATKNPRIPHSLISELDVYHVDGDKCNFHPKNLIWKFPERGLRVGKSGFRIIPGYTRYAINLAGILYSRTMDQFVSSYIDHSGYVMFGLTPDIGPRTICGQHRLLALAFHPYPSNVCSLDVNHKDANKSNNSPSNLEWVSRKGNCEHAYLNGLRSDNIPVLVRNIFSGEERKFYSIEQLSERIGMDGEGVRARLRHRGQKVYPPGILIKKEDDPTPWPEFNDPQEAVIHSRCRMPVIARNTRTGEITEFKTIIELAGSLRTNARWLHHLLSDKKPITIDEYQISFPSFEHRAKSLFTEM